jgi:hypothetical protein
VGRQPPLQVHRGVSPGEHVLVLHLVRLAGGVRVKVGVKGGVAVGGGGGGEERAGG